MTNAMSNAASNDGGIPVSNLDSALSLPYCGTDHDDVSSSFKQNVLSARGGGPSLDKSCRGVQCHTLAFVLVPERTRSGALPSALSTTSELFKSNAVNAAVSFCEPVVLLM